MNHNEERLTDAIDMNNDEYQILVDKMKSLVTRIYEDNLRLSNVYDEIQKTFSYTELVFCTTQHMNYLYESNIKSAEEEFIKGLIQKIKDISDD